MHLHRIEIEAFRKQPDNEVNSLRMTLSLYQSPMKYTILEEEVYWKPTPPDYMDGIEPHWNKIRTLVLNSSNQFVPKEPLKFDLTKGSPFQKQLQEVYEIGKKMDPEKIEIAKFWDCNPYVTHHRGHAMFATKKITPGGHWIGITAIAGRTANSTFHEAVNAYANVSISLFDSLTHSIRFIVCGKHNLVCVQWRKFETGRL